MALVHLEHVTNRFGADRAPATDGLSFTVESGRILALLGPSGRLEQVRRYFRGSANLNCLGLPSGHRVSISSQPSSAAFSNGLRARPEAHLLHAVTFPVTS